ncbi:MAG: type II secretion system F family protein [Candidatus Anammoxibacter sp.]
MPTYKFNAVNKKGRWIKNTIDAVSSQEATKKIREQGYFPSDIKEVKTVKTRKKGKAAVSIKEKKKQGISITIGRVSSKQLTNFTRQLFTLIDADIPIVSCLRMLESQMKTCLLKKSLDMIIFDIEAGSSLSEAMSKHGKAFSKIYVNTIKAGETGGKLDEVLQRLADSLEKIDRLKKKIISALTYPASVILIAGVIITCIMIFIIPNFVTMFEDMAIEGGLPIITQMVMKISNIMVDYWYFLIGVPFALFVLLKLLSKIRKIKYIMDLATFKIPVFGALIKKSTISGFCRTFATLLDAGVAIFEALEHTKDVTNNEVLIIAINDIRDSVQKGGTIGEPLLESKITDEMTVNMIKVGEETGKLEKMLGKIADNLDSEVDTIVEAMASLIEPILIVFLGGAIGLIVIALFMPMIKLMQSLGG